jgi:phosphoribosylanthranilate isomerase
MMVKICGITSVADALMAVEAGADAIGLNFAAQSPRRVGIDAAADIAAALPRGVWRVGIFVDLPRDEVQSIADRVGLDVLQFHGAENVDLCEGWDRKTIKAVRVRDAAAMARAATYRVDFLLADAYVEGIAGGTGQRVPLEWLGAVPRERLILAGGLTPENVAEVVRVVRPAGVDVASGVEWEPGVKDPEKVKRFIANARNA